MVSTLMIVPILLTMVFFLFCRSLSLVSFYFFFFSSRRRHTRCLSDWSSDVCSSDLATNPFTVAAGGGVLHEAGGVNVLLARVIAGRNSASWRLDSNFLFQKPLSRSEERRVGKECRSRWWTCHEKIKGSQGRSGPRAE